MVCLRRKVGWLKNHMIFPIKLVKLCILLVHIVEIGESSPRDYGVVVYRVASFLVAVQQMGRVIIRFNYDFSQFLMSALLFFA